MADDSTNKTEIVCIETGQCYYLRRTRLAITCVFGRAVASTVQTFLRTALTASVDRCAEIKNALSVT